MRKLSMLLVLGIAISIVFIGCPKRGGSGKLPPSNSGNTKLWKKFDTPPGADPSVPDTLGGAGFENVAEKLGFVTNQPKEDEAEKGYYGDPNAKVGGEFKIVTSQFPSTFRPEGQSSTTTQNQEIKGSVYESLLATHPITRDYTPSLASHWKISDDKLTFTFRINPDARFSDGKPVTSADVVASWKLLMDEGIMEPSNQLVYGKFNEPVALSKYIVQVKCKSLNFRNLLYFGAGMLIQPAHEIGNLTGKEYLEKFNYNMPAGSGEYIVLQQDIKEGKQWVLTRRDDYWAKDALYSRYTGNFDRIVYEVVKDNPTIEYEKFKKGECDIIRFNMLSTEKWVKDTEYEGLKNGWVKKLRVYTDGPMGTAGYAFNMRRAPFDDINVRKAWAYLLPRKQIIEKLLYNEYEPYDSHQPNTVYANPNNEKVEYNPELANKLLDEAGWSQRNSDGIRVKNGKPFIVELAIQKPSERFVTPYQQELRKAGIDMQIKFEDWNSTLKNIDERNFNVFYFGYGGLVTPNPETSLKSSLADKTDNNNIQGVKDKRIDELCDMYDSTFNVQKQIEIIREIDGITSKMYYDVFQWNPKGLRIAYWDKFGMPEYVLPRTTQLGYLYQTCAMTWWYDADKVAALEDAKKSKKSIGGDGSVKEVRYWKDFK